MTIRTEIAGCFACPAGKQPMKNMLEGEDYTWKAEPDNKFDPNAIAIYIDDVKVGYIPRAIAAKLKADEIFSIKKTNQWNGIEITLKEEEQ